MLMSSYGFRLCQCTNAITKNNQYRFVLNCKFKNFFNILDTNHRKYHQRSSVHGHYAPKTPVRFQASSETLSNRAANANLYRLVTAFREHGHRRAETDPLASKNHLHLNELQPTTYNLNDGGVFKLKGIINCDKEQANLSEVISILNHVYCGPVAAEFHHLPEEEREWFALKYEEMRLKETVDNEEKVVLANAMIKSQVFDTFLATKFGTVKRYGGEGAETMMAFFSRLFTAAGLHDVEHVVMCMPHRGRLNLLTGMLNYPVVNMFRKMKGFYEFPQDAGGTGDVLSHLTSSCYLDSAGGQKLHVTMIPNPSHLEAANPVATGKARGKMMNLNEGGYAKDSNAKATVLCLQIHGDAAFEAQGVCMETLVQANVPHFTVEGSIHLTVNNQVGFTTPADRGRSSTYSSDLAHMIRAPIIHVNGDHPEEVAKIASLALEYRKKFRKDIFVDLMCFRRWGHNELDDPTFTNPQMYSIIHARQSIPDLYVDQLIDRGVLSREIINNISNDYIKYLNDCLNQIDSYVPQKTHLLGNWESMVSAGQNLTTWDTGVDELVLKFIGAKSVQIPEDFNLHQNLNKTHVQSRLNKLTEGTNIDWATAEAVAIGSLLYQGFNVRLSGQDVGRATFSHRHAMLVDQITGDQLIPLNQIVPDQKGYFEVANSILSEEAVLGFEYGLSIENPNNLVIWEAQFGDFFNGAQIIIDTFITAGETKWLLQSGLVMMLPHGYDGAGPEHSSCRMERFLQLSDSKENEIDGDNVNYQIVHPTTPAQYFHLLRRQMVRNFRKPLLLIAPKILLRMAAATSNLSEMGPGTSFQSVIADKIAEPSQVTRVIICCGKHYYALAKERELRKLKDTAIVRLEELCPFPTRQLQLELQKYSKAKYFIWSQEEPQNMGPWTFIAPRFENLVGYKLKYVGRQSMATPAIGIGKIHQEEVKHVISKPFEIF